MKKEKSGHVCANQNSNICRPAVVPHLVVWYTLYRGTIFPICEVNIIKRQVRADYVLCSKGDKTALSLGYRLSYVHHLIKSNMFLWRCNRIKFWYPIMILFLFTLLDWPFHCSATISIAWFFNKRCIALVSIDIHCVKLNWKSFTLVVSINYCSVSDI